MAMEEVKAVRIRFVGRRWKVSFLEDLAKTLKELYGEDVNVRINSFLVQNARLPMLDVDVIYSGDSKVDDVRRAVEDLLRKHGYSLGRLLTVKEVTIRVPATEQMATSGEAEAAPGGGEEQGS